MQSKCSAEISNPFAKGAGIWGVHQSPERAGEAPCLGGCPSAEQRWQWLLLTQPGWWQGDALIRRDRLWHLSAGRRERKCHLHALQRRVWKARADPANEGETWASPHVLNLLSAVSSPPLTAEAKADVLHMPGLGFVSDPQYYTEVLISGPGLFTRALQRDEKMGQLMLPIELQARAREQHPAPAQPVGTRGPRWMATTALNHGCYQS